MTEKIEIKVQYCGGWGYKPYFDRLAVALDDEFPGELTIIPIKDRGVTGNFEVFLNGNLIHSKKRGAGLCENRREIDNIIQQINAVKKNDDDDH
jgi:selT/selW/selH-like putative selenoprotein